MADYPRFLARGEARWAEAEALLEEHRSARQGLDLAGLEGLAAAHRHATTNAT